MKIKHVRMPRTCKWRTPRGFNARRKRFLLARFRATRQNCAAGKQRKFIADAACILSETLSSPSLPLLPSVQYSYSPATFGVANLFGVVDFPELASSAI
jgi:hypothetical protein